MKCSVSVVVAVQEAEAPVNDCALTSLLSQRGPKNRRKKIMFTLLGTLLSAKIKIQKEFVERPAKSNIRMLPTKTLGACMSSKRDHTPFIPLLKYLHYTHCKVRSLNWFTADFQSH